VITHQLSSADEDWAQERAHLLQSETEKAGRRSRYGARRNKRREDDLSDHVLGQRGEIAAARVYGVSANFRPGTFHDHADIGITGEVRTRREGWHELYIRDADPVDRYYILVTGSHERGTPLRVVGGIWDRDARLAKYRRDHGGYGEAYFIPQDQLEPAETYGGESDA
jgi:hypothetical protein